MSREFPRLVHFSMAILKAFAVLVFVGLSGLAIATLLVSRDPIPAEVTGSPTLAEYPFRWVYGVIDFGDFITRAPDGEAYVQIRYDRPEAFKRLVHGYRGAVLPPSQRIITAALQVSDDGANWTDVAEAGEQSGAIAFDLGNVGAHKFWKMSVVRSGDAPEVVFGQLRFVRDKNILQGVPVDIVWLGLLPASILILVCFQVPLSAGRLFAVTAIPVVLFVFTYTLMDVGYHLVLTQDSAAYLQLVIKGSYASIRGAGYQTILWAVHKVVGLEHLAWVQLGTCIACYLAGARLLAVGCGNKWMGPVLVLAILFQGSTAQFAPAVMTEALFTAGFGLFAAALGALARRPDRPAVAAAVVGIVLAILTKSIGVVLVLPALLLMRFLPREKRFSVSGTIAIAGLATYGLLALSNFERTGDPSAESFAGYALMGQVGWMLDDTSMPPSDLTRSLIAAAAPVVEQRPADLGNIRSLATLDRYVDVTVQDFNILIWYKLFPIAESQLHTREKINSFFLRFGISSIRAHPILYLRHVAAHFYGMWRDLDQIWPVRTATYELRRAPAVLITDPFIIDLWSTIPASVLAPSPNSAVFIGESFNQSNLPLMFGRMWETPLFSKSAALALGVLALLLSILFLVPCRLALVYRTEIMMALSLNAYFGAHVLLQVAYQRYAAVATFAAIFLAVSFVFTSLCAVRSPLARMTRFTPWRQSR
jgi:hypothetical protein